MPKRTPEIGGAEGDWQNDQGELHRRPFDHRSEGALVDRDRSSGRSKGFGVVELPYDENAQKAEQALKGQPLPVDNAREQGESEDLGTTAGGPASSQDYSHKTTIVSWRF